MALKALLSGGGAVRKIIMILFLAALTLTAGCGGEPSENPQTNIPEYRKITAEQAKAIMDSDEPFILLDVRTEEEFIEHRIDGAILIPHTEIGERASAELPDKDALILIYCLRGIRSEAAARELVDIGYTNVYDFGAINDWHFGTVSGVE